MNYNMQDVVVFENDTWKTFYAENYKVEFNKITGRMNRWGKNKNDNPVLSPFGPEILDVEIVTDACNGVGNGPCKFCYKGNTNKPATSMTLDTFKKLMDRLPRINNVLFVQQLALGITGVQSSPDFIPIMEYTRSLGVIPNFTLSGFDLTDDIAKQCATLCGTIAVSCYEANKDLCYNTVRKFLDLGVKQTNIHLLYHQDNENFVYEVIDDIATDSRLRGLNAVVLLGLKPKNRGSKFIPANDDAFTRIVNYAIDKKVPLGFDSCSATKFNRWLDKTKLIVDKKSVMESVEPCESFGLFSGYVSVKSEYFPCSFAENCLGWETGINILDCNDFLQDIWFSDKVSAWRIKSLGADRRCILYPEIN